MGRPRSDFPKYCLHKPSHTARVTLSYHTHNLGPYNSPESRAKYDRLVAEWLAAGRRNIWEGDEADGGVTTINHILAAYLRHAQAYYRKNGKITNEVNAIRSAMRVLRRLYGKEAAEDFGPLKLQAVQQAMIMLDWARLHINKQISRVIRIMSWAESQELIPKGTTAALREIDGLKEGRCEARETEPISTVPDLTIDLTLPYMPPVVADMVRIQRRTAARPEDVCQFRPCDIDTSKPVWEFTPASHKMQHKRKQRIVFIGPQAQEILKPYLMREPTEYCFSPAEGERRRRAREHQARQTAADQGNRPGTNRKAKPERVAGGRYTTDSYRRAITRACQLAFRMPEELRRIPKRLNVLEMERRRVAASEWRAKHCWSPNQIRHTAATEIRERFGLEASQVTLGHKKADVTQVYAERDNKKARKVMEKMG